MAERGDEHHVRVAWIDQHAGDLPAVLQANVRPVLAGVDGFVHTVTVGDVGTHVRFAAAHVDRLWIGRCERQRTDRADILAVEDRLPGAPGIMGRPHAATDRTEIKIPVVTRDPRHGQHATTTERPDQPPIQVLKQRRVDRGMGGEGGAETKSKDGETRIKTHDKFPKGRSG
ncbi:MAG: hypothetical protein WBS20_13945 [Lysobacterales bacterium]